MSSAALTTRIEQFRQAIGSVPLLAPDATHAIDGVAPGVTALPANEDELARVLSAARAAGLAVVAIGGGSHLAAGNVPEAFDVALSTAAINRTIDHEPGDLTATVDAGVRLIDLQAALAAHGQTLPIDPPGNERGTVGGALAVDAYGPLRHAHGTLRDWVIGMRVAGVDGIVTKSGGRVVKNVTGYDMHKLHIGALGTLGVITQATFKLAPLPHTSATVTAAFDDAAGACALVMRAREGSLALHAAEVLSPGTARSIFGGTRWCALLRVAGSGAAVERSMRDLRGIVASGGGALPAHEDNDILQGWSDAFAPATLAMRCSVLPSQVADTLYELDRRLADAAPMLSATVSAGLIRVNIAGDVITAPVLVDAARGAVERAGGSVVIDAAPIEHKREVDVFGSLRSDFAIMRRVKEQFDPNRTLSPGRFAGRL